MTETPESPNTPEPADLGFHSTSESAGHGTDDRKGTVNPADGPVPNNPSIDEDAVRKGEDNLNSVTPH